MNPSRKFWKGIWLVLLLCASLAVLYVLSIGPAEFVFEKLQLRGHRLGGALEAFYSPLIFYMEQNADEYPARVLMWYVDLWAEE